MYRTSIIITLIAASLSFGCNKSNSGGGSTSADGKVTPLICMAKALQFYASGGDTFKEPGFGVSTTRVPPGYGGTQKEDNVLIFVSDTVNNDKGEKFTRTIKGEFPISWLNVQSSGYEKLVSELKTFGDFFDNSAKRGNDSAKNPLNKAPEDDKCYYGSLTINGVQGSMLNCGEAPHFHMQSMPATM